jgi:hypothetical protein
MMNCCYGSSSGDISLQYFSLLSGHTNSFCLRPLYALVIVTYANANICNSLLLCAFN